VAFDEALRQAGQADLAFLPWEGERTRSLRAWIEAPGTRRILDAVGVEGRPLRIAFLIGPEGGFSAGEVERALSAGIVPVTLGPRILRTETAGPAVLAQLSALLETVPDP
jgi:16S rRNA (uracil1498-N3)-methyltransferase